METAKKPWEKPPHNTYKLNVDATFFPNGTGATGAVLRNEKGEAMAGGYWPLGCVLDAATAEAAALQKGMLLIERLGCSPTIIESDCLELCQAYNGVSEIWSPYTAILVDCFVRAARIGSITICHYSRESNSVAHKLARFAYDSKSSFVWDGDPPSFIIPDVIHDVTLFEI